MSILFVNINVFYVYIIVSIVVLVSDRFVVFNFGVSEILYYFFILEKKIYRQIIVQENCLMIDIF